MARAFEHAFEPASRQIGFTPVSSRLLIVYRIGVPWMYEHQWDALKEAKDNYLV